MSDPGMAERLSLSSPFACEHGSLPSGAGALSAVLNGHVPASRYGPNTNAVIDFLRLGVLSGTESDVQRIAAWRRKDPWATFEAELISVAESAGLDDAARHAYADGMVVASESVDLGMTAQDVFFAHRPDGTVAAYSAATGLVATAIALERVLSPQTAAAIRGPWTHITTAGEGFQAQSVSRLDPLTGLARTSGLPPPGSWINPADPLRTLPRPATPRRMERMDETGEDGRLDRVEGAGLQTMGSPDEVRRWEQQVAAFKASRHSGPRERGGEPYGDTGWSIPRALPSERLVLNIYGSHLLFEVTDPPGWGYRLVNLVADGVALTWEMPGYTQREAEKISILLVDDYL